MLKRALTGAGFVVIMLGSIWAGPLATGILFLIIALTGLHEFYKLSGGNQHTSLPALMAGGALTGGLLFYFGTANPPNEILVFIPVILLGLFSIVLFGKQRPAFSATGILAAGILYLPISLFITAGSSLTAAGWEPRMLTGMLLIIWLYDTGAYVTGSKLGRTKLYPSVSPKKSVEGVAGGALLALITAILWANFTGLHDLEFWIVAWFLICLTGTIGDLFESQLKRSAGVKDSGNLLPGHGGILDRFDAMLFAGPFFTAWIVFYGWLM